jgi:type VI secretion system secreted protein VgrG
MTVDHLSLSCGSLGDLELVAFRGREELNRPFEFEVFFTVPEETDLSAALGQPASLMFDRRDGRPPMAWHGVFASVRLVHHSAERALCVGVLVPKLWRLRHSYRSHAHTKVRLDAFLRATLEHAGLVDKEFCFQFDTAKYGEEALVCQYRETHLDFIHRWLEREGAYYFFEHAAEEDGVAAMFVVDDKAQHGPLPGSLEVRHVPATGDDTSAGEALHDIVCERRLVPKKVVLAEYNYANPAAPLLSTTTVYAKGAGELREYGNRTFEESDLAHVGAVKAQAIACRRVVLRGRGTVSHLRAGYTFELETAPGEGLSKTWLAIEVRHVGRVRATTAESLQLIGLAGSRAYEVEVTAIPADEQFRAAQITEWPRVRGFENGVVDGPADSKYAQIDDQGRYLVRFEFDASDLPDGHGSTYLRMAQPHGGTSEGHHFPLRKGTEVMLGFQGGDPDRAYIAGAIPNALRPSVVDVTNHTFNVVRTGGGNEWVLDCLDGSQSMHFFTPYDKTRMCLGKPWMGEFYGFRGSGPEYVACTYYVDTEGTAGFSFKGGLWIDVGKTMKTHVEGDTTIEEDANVNLTVEGDATEHIFTRRWETTTGATTLKHTGHHAIHSNFGQVQYVSGAHTLARHASATDTTSILRTQLVVGDVTQNFGGQTTNTFFLGHLGLGPIVFHGASAMDFNSGLICQYAFAKFGEVEPTKTDKFGGKISVGAMKAEATGAAVAFTGVKIDTGVTATAAQAVKGDAVLGLKRDNTANKCTIGGSAKEECAFSLELYGSALLFGPKIIN